jgi:hypothetical protein
MSADKFYTMYFVALFKDNGLYERPLLKIGKIQTAPRDNPIYPDHAKTLANLKIEQPDLIGYRITSKLHESGLGLVEGFFNYYNPNKTRPPAPGTEKLHTPDDIEDVTGVKNVIWRSWLRPDAATLEALRTQYGVQPLIEGRPHYHLMENETGGEHHLMVIRPFLAEQGSLRVPEKNTTVSPEFNEAGLSSTPLGYRLIPAIDTKLGRIFVFIIHTESRDIFEIPTSELEEKSIVSNALILRSAGKEITVSAMVLHDFPSVPTPEGLIRIRGRYPRASLGNGAKPS